MKWLTRMLSESNRNKRGFTLIELMIVVIVIGILAAAGISVYTRSMDRARASEGLAILSSVRTHYLVEVAGSLTGTGPAPGGTLEADWGIDTDRNKWWIEGTGFTVDWTGYVLGTSYVVKLTGTGDLEGQYLSIDCDSGEIIESY